MSPTRTAYIEGFVAARTGCAHRPGHHDREFASSPAWLRAALRDAGLSPIKNTQ